MIAAELLQGIHQQLSQMVTGDDWLNVLKQASRFHDYSFANQLLIMSQRPDATRVMGYKQWPRVNRYVRKGEKGIAILAPLVRTEKTEDEHGKESKTRTVIGFRVVYVFDVSQTDGEPLASDLPSPELLEGEAPEHLREFLIRQIQGQGFTLRFPGTANWPEPEVRGWTNFREKVVAIAPGLSDAQQAKTLAHEFGHITLNHQEAGHRGMAEIEAESYAAVMMMATGLNSLTYSLPYLAGWSGGDMKLVMATATKVVAFANMTIIDWADYSTQLMLQF
ncbi:ArdC-like ssDNA-binding domain-containing protein [Nakamurella sp. PAMC28650]|uniref:ArdC-like ssDNA-binding domain-containing protein n=1 Tax=Nakamurella sp. PAMC28650 TaxID=2762325 RepID=UPI00164E6F70|nr:ArdC-like ssDNA-binding domain-containing protein [Nakamurella sp. PAMC28650]QNK82613.1 ImmA/IrrE family metallo-endopeptidase [Nakamurella sp. PAMC28650]